MAASDDTEPHVVPVDLGPQVQQIVSELGVLLGIMYNDAAISNAPLDDRVQEQLAVFCFLLGCLIERRDVEQALEHERNQMRTLLDLLPEAVYVKDTKLRYLVANAAAKRLGTPTPADLVGQTDTAFLETGRARELKAEDEEVLRSGRSIVNMVEVLEDEREGRRTWLKTKVPLRDTTGRITGLIGIAHDISDIAEAQEERRRVEARLLQACRPSPAWFGLPGRDRVSRS